MHPLRIAEDRSMSVPPGKIVRTGYVPIDSIKLACKARMDIAAVEKAMQRRLGIEPHQPWPCPVGEWQDGRFSITDGRHDAIAAMCLGVEMILVAWIEEG